MIGQHLHAQQLQTLCIGLDILERHEGQVQGVHMGHHAHCKSCHSEAFAVPVLNDLHVSQAPLRLAFPVHSLQVVSRKYKVHYRKLASFFLSFFDKTCPNLL